MPCVQCLLRRWSFNRTGLDGRYRADSLKEDGSPYSLAEVVGTVAQSLFDQPQLARVPASWSEQSPEAELRPFGQARAALLRLARGFGAPEATLDLEGRLGLWRQGEGRVGWGQGNQRPFPPELLLYRQGTGQGEGTEAAYPPDWIVVVGGKRVASVQLDDLEPVLVIDGEPVPLDERVLRRLTRGKHGLEWLAAFVLVPQAWQNDVAVRPEVIQLFREQAWRLWRIHGVEQDADAKVPEEVIHDFISGQRQATRDARTTLPGPNAHLLPLLPRAETRGGRRLPVKVETYRFASAQIAMAPSAEQQAIAKTQQRLRDLRRRIEAAATTRGKPSPWQQSEWFALFSERYASPKTLWSFVEKVQSAGVSYGEFMDHFQRARLLDRIQEAAPGLASSYDQELTKLFGVEGELGGLGPELWELAKELVAFEKQAAEQRSALESVDSELEDQAEALKDKVAATLRKVAQKRDQQRRRTRAGAGRKKLQPQHAQFLRNLPRKTDPHASLVSAELGIVRTGELSGHVKDPGVPVAEATTFVPKSPLVTFGAVVRPRLNTRRPVTGSAPAALSDCETFYTAAFRRVRQGVVQAVPLDSVPEGHGVVVQRPDLVELVPLEGAGNREALNRTAEDLARELARGPDLTRGGFFVIARPWPVECNGVVSGVEIRLRPGGKGFLTTVYLGSEAQPQLGVGSTRERGRGLELSDAAARKGAGRAGQ